MSRVGRLGVTCVLSIVLSACGTPPDKEIDQAVAALVAARQAGADKYSPEEFTAAEQALAGAREAVGQRDYRLALNNALDARERALMAASDAMEKKAQARARADAAMTEATAVLTTARERMKAPGRTHASGRTLAALRRATTDAEAAVQEALTAFGIADYLRVPEIVTGPIAKLQAALQEDEAAPAPPPRRRR